MEKVIFGCWWAGCWMRCVDRMKWCKWWWWWWFDLHPISLENLFDEPKLSVTWGFIAKKKDQLLFFILFFWLFMVSYFYSRKKYALFLWKLLTLLPCTQLNCISVWRLTLHAAYMSMARVGKWKVVIPEMLLNYSGLLIALLNQTEKVSSTFALFGAPCAHQRVVWVSYHCTTAFLLMNPICGLFTFWEIFLTCKQAFSLLPHPELNKHGWLNMEKVHCSLCACQVKWNRSGAHMSTNTSALVLFYM